MGAAWGAREMRGRRVGDAWEARGKCVGGTRTVDHEECDDVFEWDNLLLRSEEDPPLEAQMLLEDE